MAIRFKYLVPDEQTERIFDKIIFIRRMLSKLITFLKI
ncbi:hypothetical protein [Gelidibacter sediminis]|nr:hypothetical protein [Gelidibacter sediminis]